VKEKRRKYQSDSIDAKRKALRADGKFHKKPLEISAPNREIKEDGGKRWSEYEDHRFALNAQCKNSHGENDKEGDSQLRFARNQLKMLLLVFGAQMRPLNNQDAMRKLLKTEQAGFKVF
jgi:hypothetical protein